MTVVRFAAWSREEQPLHGWLPVPTSNPDAAAIPPAAIWRRLEHWAGRYFIKRPITFEFEGPGFVQKQDVAFEGAEYQVMDWNSGEIVTIPAPMPRNAGKQYVPAGRYRATGLAGLELALFPEITYAAGMFANYLAEVQKAPEGAHIAAESYSISLGGDVTESWRKGRNPVANALFASGAASILLPFKKTKGKYL
ncbi:hypothetical protein [Paracoccus endophyticus]|uniref:hypothetical protein n=1 Tax=Paracoccus endophyticus TaxID=2233774 RepID=UPI000DD7989F|nr:hypothetical protein [Paracoccus endophyticus]